MKSKIVLTIGLVSAMSLGGVVPSVSAHDELGKDFIEKGTRVGFNNVIPSISGSKNFKWQEISSQQIKLKNGVQNNTADVYVHKGFAYTGTHTQNGGNGGVRVWDIKNPNKPKEISVFGDDIEGTWQEKVIVKSVNTKHFKGSLAVVSVQQIDRNDPKSVGGFLLYDVTDPYQPKKLGFWSLDKRVRGTHELYLTVQNGNPYVLAANPYADYYTHGEQKDFQIVDVSNPAKPTTIYQFDPRSLPDVQEDFDGYNWNAPDGKTRPAFNHSTMTDKKGQTAFLSFWDLGTIILDIKNPKKPKVLGRTTFSPNQQGSAHSVALAKGEDVLVETREVYNPTKEGYEQAYGYTRIFDIKNKKNPTLLSEFKTELVANIEDGVTFGNTVHDPKVQGNTLYLSHYAGGVRAVDISRPAHPFEIGKYIPENADVWGVFVDKDYVFASDMGTGLKVLKKNN
ncbi:LVIVD repeat-containing protein [Fictibacillus sp. NRS-1165]|uniref:LVIVD repeat-containing protein n=1 Tax=Fictibacillus sp. NRS-1165 TaxID=3144463 RepID=UPI003D1A719E